MLESPICASLLPSGRFSTSGSALRPDRTHRSLAWWINGAETLARRYAHRASLVFCSRVNPCRSESRLRLEVWKLFAATWSWKDTTIGSALRSLQRNHEMSSICRRPRLRPRLQTSACCLGRRGVHPKARLRRRRRSLCTKRPPTTCTHKLKIGAVHFSGIRNGNFAAGDMGPKSGNFSVRNTETLRANKKARHWRAHVTDLCRT